MSASHAALKLATDRCVKCALCLPVCPTYQLTRDEAQSPRGRIALIQALADGALSAADTLPHIDPCLACRACEKVCPAKVPYGAILDAGREIIRQSGIAPSFAERLAAWLLASPFALHIAAAAWRIVSRLPVSLRGHGRLARMLAMPSPRGAAQLARHYPMANARGTVAVTGGCVSEYFDAAATVALCRLLNACDYSVDVVSGCCGGLYQHQGALDRARAMAQRLIDKLRHRPYAAILHPATGCAAAMRDYARLLGSSDAEAVSDKVTDAGQFLCDAGIEKALQKCAPREATIAVHAPCSQRNVTGGDESLYQLVAALPGVTVVRLTGSGCCGAAGNKMLDPASNADQLAGQLLAPLRAGQHVDLLVSPNIGCAWHLRAALSRDGPSVPVLHPAVLLADRLLAGN